MLNSGCPCCGAEINLIVTRHAVERLEERAYAKFLRGSLPQEGKAQYITRMALQAIKEGTKVRSEPGNLMKWYQGMLYVFRESGGKLVLVTLIKRNPISKHAYLPTQRDVLNYLAGGENG